MLTAAAAMASEIHSLLVLLDWHHHTKRKFTCWAGSTTTERESTGWAGSSTAKRESTCWAGGTTTKREATCCWRRRGIKASLFNSSSYSRLHGLNPLNPKFLLLNSSSFSSLHGFCLFNPSRLLLVVFFLRRTPVRAGLPEDGHTLMPQSPHAIAPVRPGGRLQNGRAVSNLASVWAADTFARSGALKDMGHDMPYNFNAGNLNDNDIHIVEQSIVTNLNRQRHSVLLSSARLSITF